MRGRYRPYRSKSEIDKPGPDDPRWLSADEFEQVAVEQWCWIQYKGRVVRAYYTAAPRRMFAFCPQCTNAYMTECVTGVIPGGPGRRSDDEPTPEP